MDPKKTGMHSRELLELRVGVAHTPAHVGIKGVAAMMILIHILEHSLLSERVEDLFAPVGRMGGLCKDYR